LGVGGAGPPAHDSPDPETNSVVAATIQRAVEQASPPDVLSDVISGLGVLLAPLRNPDDLTPARVLAEKVLRLVAHMSPDLEMLAAIGGAAELERASHSFTQARRTLNAVSAMPDLGPIASWDELGVFRALVLVAPSEAENGAIDPRIRQLLNDAPLAETAETFLDLAGNVQKTAARLFVHRTTLYQRLDRITELYKLDLRRSGDDRLIAHLGFKLARVARS
jgi:sugar diacid utilization regulator